MAKMTTRPSFFLLIGILLAVPTLAEDDPIKVFVSIPPQAFFVERIGGPQVEVEVLVPPGQCPETYEIGPVQMAKLAEARLFFAIGVPLEEAILRSLKNSAPRLRVVDTREGIELLELPAAHGHHHEEEEPHPGHSHASGETDPHTWLDPARAKVQAERIRLELCKVDPDRADEYRKNLESLLKDLEAVDRRIADLLSPHRGKAFYVFHPSYGYFGDRYGLKQVAVEAEGKEPSARKLPKVIERARADRAKAVFVQPQFTAAGAAAVAKEIGGELVMLDPLSRDYLRNLEDMAMKVAAALND